MICLPQGSYWVFTIVLHLTFFLIRVQLLKNFLSSLLKKDVPQSRPFGTAVNLLKLFDEYKEIKELLIEKITHYSVCDSLPHSNQVFVQSLV